MHTQKNTHTHTHKHTEKHANTHTEKHAHTHIYVWRYLRGRQHRHRRGCLDGGGSKLRVESRAGRRRRQRHAQPLHGVGLGIGNVGTNDGADQAARGAQRFERRVLYVEERGGDEQRLAYIGAMWRRVAERFSLDFRSKWLRCGLAEKRCVAGRCVALVTCF